MTESDRELAGDQPDPYAGLGYDELLLLAGDQPDPYAGPGDDELPLPAGLSHVWTEGMSTDGENGQ